MTRYFAASLFAAAVGATTPIAPLTLHAQDPQPAAPAPRPALDTLQPRTAPLGARVDTTTDGGRFVLLADGTRWEVDPQDRPGADAWQRGDFVLVRPNPAPTGDPIRGFNAVLVNGEARRAVLARFAGAPRAGG